MHQLPRRLLIWLLLCCSGWLPLLGHGQTPPTRSFPPHTHRGELLVMQPPQVQINGVNLQLSPGARIHGRRNQLVMSAALIGQTVTVRYLRNGFGDITEVWLLTQEEAQQGQQGNWTTEGADPVAPSQAVPFNQLPRYPN